MNSQPSAVAKKDSFYLIRALHSRNYRLFFSGQSLSLIGTWMTQVATWWLVWRLTNSAFMVGVVNFAGQMPAFVVAPLAGVWIDRLERHRLLVITQVFAMLQSFGLAAVAFANIDKEHKIILLIALCAFQGLINSFDGPTRQAMVVEMVEDKNDLGNAIALNSSMLNLARMIGPSIAGLAVALVGEGWCFTIDGISYIAVIASLLMMRVTPREIASKKNTLVELREGWRYATRFMPIRTILTLLCIVSLGGMSYRVLVPAVAEKILHGNSVTFGLLMGSTAVGALIGAIVLAARQSVLGIDKQILYTTAVFGLGLMLFGVSHSMWLSLPLLAVVGFGNMLVDSSGNTLLQTIVDEDKCGRVMGLYRMSNAFASLGGLLIGALSNSIGLTWCLIICGACCLAGAVWFARTLPRLRLSVRPVYREKGILPRPAGKVTNHIRHGADAR
jgi:MFS family permease